MTTLPSIPSHQTVLTDVSAISISEFPALAINPVVPWGWRGPCGACTSSSSRFQLAHGTTALPLLLAHPGYPVPLPPPDWRAPVPSKIPGTNNGIRLFQRPLFQGNDVLNVFAGYQHTGRYRILRCYVSVQITRTIY